MVNIFRSKPLLPVLLSSLLCFTSTAANPVNEEKQQQASLESAGSIKNAANLEELQLRIAYGIATVAEVRKALTESDPYALTNTVHAMFAMRWQRGVVHLLNGMWALDKQKYPELSWDLISTPPVRIALASTINRIRIVNTDEFKSYIRRFKNDDQEFNRAQVSVALGFNGDPLDLTYLQAMCNGDNHYVAQSAITALSVFGGDQARDILIELSEKHQGTPRGDLMVQMLKKAYHWPPLKTPG